MKNKIFHFIALSTAAITMVGCVDTEIDGISATQLDSLANLSYLKEYGSLKEYVNRSENPNFKLGAGVAASSFINSDIEYRVAAANFDEVTVGNAMKYASCVNDKGEMDFGTVMSFIEKAKEDGITIYGHTLAWHAQQNNKYLNSLIADKKIEVDPDAKNEIEDKIINYSDYNKFPFFVMGYEPEIIDGVLTSNCPTDWHQYFVIDGVATKANTDYKITAMIRATKEHEINVQFGNWGALNEGRLKISTEWEEKSVTINSGDNTNSFSVFQPGVFDGTIEIKWVKVTHGEAPVFEVFTDHLTNGEMAEGKPMDNFVVRESGKSDVPGTPIAGGPEGKNCIKITSVADPANSWDTQFFIYTPNKVWNAGEEYKISFWYKASEAAGCESQCHAAPGAYLHWSMLPSNPNFTTEWQYYEKKGTIPGEVDGKNMMSIAFNLNVNKNKVDYYFADIHWSTIGKGNTIPLTDEEKKDTLTWAMSNWINGMMEACGGYVTTWDVVNEAIAGVDKDGDGYYDLQSATRNTVSEADKADNFYWQDYLGDVDYVRTAVKLAREAYAANGGEGALKLFINDYNLESDWDQNKKVKSLVEHWIPLWEEDGTKIDGIGSQMHVSCFENEATMQSKKNAVVEMFKILASSKKLIKISELDMGYVDAAGNSVKTENLTDEQAKQMAEYYKFIIEQYFANIPAEQRYGITQWALTDSPDGSGWRGGEPIGLWTQKWDRKRTFGGFADGLIGK